MTAVEYLQLWVGRLGGIAALAALGVALYEARKGGTRPLGRLNDIARWFLRLPVLALAAFGFLGLGILLWILHSPCIPQQA